MRMNYSEARTLIKKGFPARTLDDYPDDSKIMLPVEVKTTSRVKGGLAINVLIGKNPNPFSRKGRPKKSDASPRLMRTFRISAEGMTK
jgi:predicted secreted protein